MNEKMQKLADQVAGKIHWGASKTEVREWLQDENQISGDDAEQLIERGFKARRGEVRQRALLRLIFAGIGLLAFVAFLYVQYFGNFVLIGLPVLIAWGLGLASIGVIWHSLSELVTGDSDRPM
jgi:hypothetical protein